uniref:Uncharacterized protein n=1 Tax=Verrucosispora sp. MS100047 TaxID=1410949 RepID=A0A097CT60_9ACTN|nr:hypothetical protein VASRM7_623 [Verrucosispora sp. MS100047]
MTGCAVRHPLPAGSSSTRSRVPTAWSRRPADIEECAVPATDVWNAAILAPDTRTI